MNKKPIALVTGSGRGIGRGIALELARNGFDIAGNDIVLEPDTKKSGLLEVKAKAEELGAQFYPVQGDVSSLEDHKRMIEEVLTEYGRIDVLVNNAGVAPEDRKDVLETMPESYDRVMEINSRGPFFFSQRVANIMIGLGGQLENYKPSMIFITSISAEVSSPSRAEYCVSKAALSMTAKIFADRLTEYNIPVYEIRPGIIKTDMTKAVEGKYNKLIDEGLIPQNRWGYPEDIGKAAAALAGGAFGYSTGMVLEVSGGMNIRHL